MNRALTATIATLVATCAVAWAAMPSAASAAGGPPLPKAANGKPVKRFATGVAIPTQITFSGGKAFIAGAAEGKFKGGLFVVKPGAKVATKVPGTPKTAFGIASKGGKVYLSSGRNVIRYSGWKRGKFNSKKTIYTGAKSFTGFSGMAIGPNGRLYAGVALNQKYDHAKDPSPFGNSVVSMTTGGRDVKVVATGMRQPWMMTFAKGNPDPFVSVLGQDTPMNNGHPDLIVNARQGDDYGFPVCDRLIEGDCDGFAEPLVEFEAIPGKKNSLNQQSPMGLAASGGKLYAALFSGDATGPKVLAMDTDGTGAKPFLSGFVAPVLSVATHGGMVYAGDLTGTIYRVKG